MSDQESLGDNRSPQWFRDEVERLRAENDRLRQDRYDALDAKTTEGMSAAEWQMRTGKAERERKELRADLENAQRLARIQADENDRLREERDAAWVDLAELRASCGACEGCDCPLSECGPALWAQQKKCCPDCSHKPGAGE